ncbi:MAG: Tm-1-like ATP-binding domain-containing protein [Candidatus Poribacteria bacterium]|nr:Tm-1-like ATP-binding domain-containing protein [Candidatus Poribacteria bacterium]
MSVQKPTVVILSTLDTKSEPTRFLKDRIEQAGCATHVVDTGVLGEPDWTPDTTRYQVAEAADSSIEILRRQGHRGKAVGTMAEGAREVVIELQRAGKLDGVISLGGGQGTVIGTTAMRGLPVGVPKLMVSTMASGITGHYVGTRDIAMIYSVVDVMGSNSILRQVLANAAGAIAGMAQMPAPDASTQKTIALTSFGITTPCVLACVDALEQRGYEAAVFHANGTGGKSMEEMIRANRFVGVLDITTTELADEVVGGILSAGPDRLEAAGDLGIPQVVVPGALDVVNLGGRHTVEARVLNRQLHEHSPVSTLVRTTVEENAVLGNLVAVKLNRAKGPVTVCIPMRGFSDYGREGGPIHHAEADCAFTEALRSMLRPDIPVHTLDVGINDPKFAGLLVDNLLKSLNET